MSVRQLRPQCPHARLVEGATPADGGIVCGAMKRDQARKDPILEGAPVGVFISVRDDLRTVAAFCCGTDAPSPDGPDAAGRGAETVPARYTSCPIFAADREIGNAERMYAMPERQEAAVMPGMDGEQEIELRRGDRRVG